MIRLLARPAIFVLVASFALFAPQLAGGLHGASTITVNTVDDDVTKNNRLTLREAIMLATGHLDLLDLSQSECGQINPSEWVFAGAGTCTAGFPEQPPGPASADTILFDIGTFPAPPATYFVSLDDSLPSLDTGNDTIDGSGVAGIRGDPQLLVCLIIASDDNTVKGLQFTQCSIGVSVHANNNVIGGTAEDERNVFSLNLTAVRISDNAHNNRIIGNYIGTDAGGTGATPNNFGVRLILGAHDNIIGGPTEAERNVISGNAKTGIWIVNADRNMIQGNYIGINAAGDTAVPNLTGILIDDDSEGNTVGGTGNGEGNVISGNPRGVEISGDSAGNVVEGNFIGTDASGANVVPNTVGVRILGGAINNVVGGTTTAARNVISGSTDAGVYLNGPDSNTVIGNYIGTDASGQNALANKRGVWIDGGANNFIGGVVPGQGNLIAFNTEAGVRVDGEAGNALGNTIRGNSIHSNGGEGIENVNMGNAALPPPLITGLGSVTGTACPGCRIDVYSDDENEGAVYEGAILADGNGDWTFPGNPGGPNVTATATDDAGTTSEFSVPAVVPDTTPTPSPSGQTATPAPTPPPTTAPGETPGSTPTPTIPVDQLTQGDNDCDGDTDSVDALAGLRHLVALDVIQQPGCPALGGALPTAAPASAPALFGDVDCDGDVDAVDALKVLKFVAALPFTQNEPCTDIGDPL